MIYELIPCPGYDVKFWVIKDNVADTLVRDDDGNYFKFSTEQQAQEFMEAL